MECKFKPFRETYRMITFAMCIGLIYPNPKTIMWKAIALPLLILSIAPLAMMMLTDMYFSWLDRDIVNMIRHSTVVGPFLGGFFKIILMFYKQRRAKEVIDEIDRDYESYNYLAREYKLLIAKSIHNSKIYCERTWVIIVLICVMTFTAMAIVLNTYNFLFKTEPIKYMIHDLNKPFSEKEARFDSPYFEISFVYMFYASILSDINFIGFDGFFGLCINHACLKLELICKSMEDALAGPMTEMHEKIVGVIQDHNRMFEYVDGIQDTFNIWLGLIFIATMIQICTCMYHITEMLSEDVIDDVARLPRRYLFTRDLKTPGLYLTGNTGYGFDLRYMIFASGAIIHIYLPCRYAAKLKALSGETGTKFYSSGWENVNNQRVRNMVLFMVARGQVPIEITAFNMIAFDMELFVSIMQSSYSMFTLLRS